MKYTIEFEAHWSDGVIDEEQTLEVEAGSKYDAERIGKSRLFDMDGSDNEICYCVDRRYIRCVESDSFEYASSIKLDHPNGFEGYGYPVRVQGF